MSKCQVEDALTAIENERARLKREVLEAYADGRADLAKALTRTRDELGRVAIAAQELGR